MPFLNAFGTSINVFIDIPTNGAKNVVENNNYGVPSNFVIVQSKRHKGKLIVYLDSGEFGVFEAKQLGELSSRYFAVC